MITKDQFLNQVQQKLNLQPQQVFLIPDARALYSALAIRDEFHKNVVALTRTGHWKVYARYTHHFNQYNFESKKRPSLERAMDDVSEAHLAIERDCC